MERQTQTTGAEAKPARPFKVTHSRSLARSDALCLAAVLDAGFRVLLPQPNSFMGWRLSAEIPNSDRLLYIQLEDYVCNPSSPVPNWAWAWRASINSGLPRTEDPRNHYFAEMPVQKSDGILHETSSSRMHIKEWHFVPKTMMMMRLVLKAGEKRFFRTADPEANSVRSVKDSQVKYRFVAGTCRA